MPGTLSEWHELEQLAIAPNQQVCGHLESANLGKIGMRVPVEAIGKQCFDFRAAKFPRWQAYAVQHNQLRLAFFGSRVAIAARHLPRLANQPVTDVNVEFGGHGAGRSGMISMT